MNNLPRQMLRQILIKYGKDICSNARRCENLLKDLCGSYRREINVLVTAIEERVPLDLLAANRSMPLELLLTKLEKRLEEQTAMTGEAARWSVESWSLALNLATESEIQARRKRIEPVTPAASKAETAQPGDSAVGGKMNRQNPFQPPKTPTTVPQSRVSPPPVLRQPTQMPNHAPPVIFPTNNQTLNPPPVHTQRMHQPVIARKSFGFFRGCLFVIFLLAVASTVLILGVPYAIEVMRETQRERNNQPPRFPER
ncbi:MAG: hypothetical protein LH614_21815 [Pyrinomonadaceae bacterium]|nr:hypothetical protein [Pyrinomonadaceae bacterium]